MRKKGKKVLACLLAISLVASMTGCEKKSDTKEDGKNGSTTQTSGKTNEDHGEKEGSTIDHSEPITLDVFSATANYQGIQTGFFGKMVKDKFNIELNIIAPNVAGGGDALYQTRSAAGNLGDIVQIEKSDMKDCIEAGLIMDVTELYNHTKNLKMYDNARIKFNEYAGIAPEKVFAIPTDVSNQPATEPFILDGAPYVGSFMRLDYYNELGAPKMKDYSDMLQVLKKMQDAHPKTEDGNPVYGFSLFGDWDGDYMTYACKFAFMYGYGEGVNFAFPNADASSFTHPAEDNGVYYKALKMLFDANQMGLVDPDSSTQNWDTVYAKMQAGQTLFGLWPWHVAAFNTTENKAQGKGITFVPLEDEKIMADGYKIYGNAVVGVGSKTKYPERVMEFLDWMNSSEAIYAGEGCKAGIRGYTWDIKNGRPELTEAGIKCMDDEQTMMPEEYGGGTFRDGASQIHFNITDPAASKDPETGESYYASEWKSERERNAGPLDNLFKDIFGTSNAVEYLEKNNQIVVAPSCNFVKSIDDSDTATKRAQCGDIITQSSWQMIFAKDEAEFNEIWDRMKTQLKGFGYEEVLAIDAKDVERLHEERMKVIQDSGK